MKAFKAYMISTLTRNPKMSSKINKGVRQTKNKGFDAPVLFNEECQKFVMNAEFGSAVSATIHYEDFKEGVKKVKFGEIKTQPYKLVTKILGAIGQFKYNEKPVFLSKSHTIRRLFTLNVYYSLPKDKRKLYKASNLYITEDMTKYMPNSIRDTLAKRPTAFGKLDEKGVPSNSFNYSSITVFASACVLRNSEGTIIDPEVIVGQMTKFLESTPKSISEYEYPGESDKTTFRDIVDKVNSETVQNEPSALTPNSSDCLKIIYHDSTIAHIATSLVSNS
jgi:hypothetical protein